MLIKYDIIYIFQCTPRCNILIELALISICVIFPLHEHKYFHNAYISLTPFTPHAYICLLHAELTKTSLKDL
jgi:hypothetical protein